MSKLLFFSQCKSRIKGFLKHHQQNFDIRLNLSQQRSSSENNQLEDWAPAVNYMRSKMLVLTREFEKRANLCLSPGGSKPESTGMFQAEVLWCGSEPRHAVYCKGIISFQVVLVVFTHPNFPFLTFVHFLTSFTLLLSKPTYPLRQVLNRLP